jgi:tetratricopeptide (TPR) repeat protein
MGRAQTPPPVAGSPAQGATPAQSDTQLLNTLLQTPDRTAEISAVVDRIVARIPATATPETRFTSISSTVGLLVGRKVLLDRAEELLTGAVRALDFEKYVAQQADAARTANRPETSRDALQTTYNQSYRARGEYELGRLYAAKGDAARAETAFKASIALYPTYPAPALALATLYTDTGQKEKAEAFLKDTLKATPGHTGALSALASHYERENKPDQAEALLRAAFNATPPNPAAMSLLVGFYERGNQTAKAEALLEEALTSTPTNVGALTSLVSLYDRAKTPEKAEGVLRRVLARDAAVPQAWIALARIEQKRGDDAKALESYLQAASASYLRGADLTALTALYQKVRGSDNGLEAELDKRYLAMPKAVKAVRYTPTSGRSERLVLVEMFTGSGCPPCVAADLAFDALLERYPSPAIVPIAYHVHIPQPDPMTTSESEARRLFYSVTGVPTAQIDGVMVASPATGGNLGGGGRDRSPTVYEAYTTRIDRALETPAQAALSVRAHAEGDEIRVTATVSKIPADARDLRLHLVIAERELMFGGENGIRQHPMVVRAVAGEKGLGLPLSVTGETKHTFSLTAIREDITRSLAAEIARRRPAPLAPGATSAFAAESRAMTTIDPAHLVVVAFVQAADKKVLQATRSDVVVGSAGRGPR